MTYRERKRYRAAHRPSKVLLAVFVLLLAAGSRVLSAAGYVLSVAASAPPLDSLKPVDQGTSSAVYAADGTRLGFIQSDEIRTPIPLQRIPESMQAATVAIEDERFYRARRRRLRGHRPRGLQEPRGRQGRRGRLDDHAAARPQPVRGPRAHAGAQDPRGPLAEELEDSHSKRWILESYLNSVPYGTVDGQTAVGVQAAAQTFFDKPPRT